MTGDMAMSYGHAERNLALIRQLEAETSRCSRAWTGRFPSSKRGCRRVRLPLPASGIRVHTRDTFAGSTVVIRSQAAHHPQLPETG